MSQLLAKLERRDGSEIVEHDAAPLAAAGTVANEYAAAGAFADYLIRKAENTVRRQAADLALFSEYLSEVVEDPPAPEDLQHDPEAWAGVTWGLVEGFVRWQIRQGYAVSSVNVRLSTVKTYAGLANKAGTIGTEALALIRDVSGYTRKEAKRINENRDTTRIGVKKSEPVPVTLEDARRLKAQPLGTPQGRRDRLLMCLLIDHGLRVSEVAGLSVGAFDLDAGEVVFYRQKVDKTQRHKLTADTARALRAYVDAGDAPAAGPILRGSRKDGQLTSAGMTTRAITKRVRTLGAAIGVEGLSAHDLRHYAMTDAAEQGTDPFALQEFGGWTSIGTARQYVRAAEIANENVKQST